MNDYDEQFITWRIERLATRLNRHDYSFRSQVRGAVYDEREWEALLDEIDCNPRIK